MCNARAQAISAKSRDRADGGGSFWTFLQNTITVSTLQLTFARAKVDGGPRQRGIAASDAR